MFIKVIAYLKDEKFETTDVNVDFAHGVLNIVHFGLYKKGIPSPKKETYFWDEFELRYYIMTNNGKLKYIITQDGTDLDRPPDDINEKIIIGGG